MSRVDEVLNQISDGGSVPSVLARMTPDESLEDYPVELRGRADSSETPMAAPPPAALSQVPVAVTPATAARQSQAAFRRSAASIDPAGDGKLILSGHVPPVTVEQYRRLAATLHEAQEVRGLKRLMVASALPNDGKTLTAINLALTLSESYGQRVLLVDADLRRPSVHGILKLSNRTGLTDLLRSTGHDPLPVTALSTCLSVLPAGRPDASPLAGLTSGRMKEVLDEAGSQFDWVIIDTPPLGLLPDAQVVARLADAVLLVVSAGITPYQLVQRAIADVGTDRIIGVVLNRAELATTMSSYYESYYISSDGRGRGPDHG